MKIQELERYNSILSHKLADQEATTKLEMNKRNMVQQEIKKQQEDNVTLRKQREQWCKQFGALHRSAKVVEEDLWLSVVNIDRIVSKLTSFDQRIKFAGSRIHFLSGRETSWTI